MLKVHDIRDSRDYRDAKEEGLNEGIEIAKLAAQQMSAEEIAASLKLDVEVVRQALAKLLK